MLQLRAYVCNKNTLFTEVWGNHSSSSQSYCESIQYRGINTSEFNVWEKT